MTTDELIDCLTGERNPGLGYHPTMNLDGFVCEGQPEVTVGILDTQSVSESAVLRTIVGRGVESLPALLAHLTDPRMTGIVIEKPMRSFGAMWFGDEYDPRFRNPSKQLRDVNQGCEWRINGEYMVRVGDLCYVAIGQIVNRKLSCVRYQPSACVVINSPVENPNLVNAVLRDWNEVSEDEHLKSLMDDLRDEERRSGAYARLRYYYPSEYSRLPQKQHEESGESH